MTDIILHHYPQSPVSEKVRVALGIKNLTWRSVEIPRLPPKPDLMPLTGGYRLTPVMQIGADVYCDSQCILRELERRVPEPTLFPGGANGLAWGVGQWIDGPLFTGVIALVFADAGDDMPPAFAADRGPLYFGPGYDMAALQAALPQTLAEVRAQ
ncbi:MAG: glutathione S-transferase N-terminal domain-containing protein, partial [Kiloniellaceae bacterium]